MNERGERTRRSRVGVGVRAPRRSALAYVRLAGAARAARAMRTSDAAPLLSALLLALALLAFCAGASLADVPAAALDAIGLPPGGGPVDVGRAPPGVASVEAEACAICHAEHFDEWARSSHHLAYTNPVFQAEYGVRRRDFCAYCHAPRRDVSAAAEAAGIDCASCHVRDGVIINTVVSGWAPHPSRAVAALGTVDACATCHDFDFEGQPGEALQATLAEWAESPAGGARGTSCQECHMEARPVTGEHLPHHRHDWPGGVDPAMLARALEVTLEVPLATSATEAGSTSAPDELASVRLRLRASAEVGHAVPTGDMFRRLEVRVWPRGAPERAETQWLRRRFRVDRAGWHQSSDTRVPARGERVVEVALPRAANYEWSIHLWLLPRREAEAAGIPIETVRTLVSASGASATTTNSDSNILTGAAGSSPRAADISEE